MGRLPEAWVAPPPTRELRELVRHRAKLVALRAGCKCEVHAVLATCGIPVPIDDLFSDVGWCVASRDPGWSGGQRSSRSSHSDRLPAPVS